MGGGQHAPFPVPHASHGHCVQNAATVKARQLPATQTSSTAHDDPQPPQWSGLFCVSTQAAPHFVIPEPHAAVHLPTAHTSLARHA